MSVDTRGLVEQGSPGEIRAGTRKQQYSKLAEKSS